MIRIGVVNIDVSHPLAFSKILLEGDRARYIAVFNDGFRSDEEVDAFIRKRRLLCRCATVDELAEMVDVGFIQGCNWDKHLSYIKPFMDRNKPVFIDKPIVGCMKDVRLLEQLMQDGLQVMGGSSMRYAEEIQRFLAIPEEERGSIINIMGTCGVDEFNYGIHVVEAIGAMAHGCTSVQYMGTATQKKASCDSYAVTFDNNVTASYITVNGTWLPCNFLVTTTKNVFSINVDISKVYAAMLTRICDWLENGDCTLSSLSDVIESVKIMLAGRLSKIGGGQIVRIADIPDDDPGYDGHVFEKAYAYAASPIYLKEPEI